MLTTELQIKDVLFPDLLLSTLHRKRLLGSPEACEVLRNANMASLLPPVGVEVFKRFTPASLEEINRRQAAKQQEAEQQKEEQKKHENVEVQMSSSCLTISTR